MNITTKKRLPRYIGSLLAIIAVFAVFSPIGEAKSLYGGVLRLHIIAASDLAADQEVKLAVRDGLLEDCSFLFEDCTSAAEAAECFENNRTVITQSVRKSLDNQGCTDESFRISLTNEYYESRDYGSFTMPAGEYASLRILIGEAEGKNWWCVLFPPLCTKASEVPFEALTSAGVDEKTASDVTIGKQGYRFRIVEFFGELKGFFSGLC